ncbi:MAG TPA: carboxypeptidase-like regulatory domain-containing protein [Bryobacteraceae bacterium]|nr:carboxypeptidase-like regulatory domain-containing protein [Bryobacteraceae bacterium]
MSRIWIAALLVGAVAVAYGQVVPQQKTPPIFKGDKKPKEEDGKSRSLTGVVTDESEAPADGGVVQLKDTKTLQVRSFITKEDGTYHFHGLSPDVDYQVKAERKGAASGVKTLSVFDSRKSAVINLKLEQKK